MADVTETIQVVFVKSFESDTLDFMNGTYKRFFDRKDEPFSVTPQEWRTLMRTGIFEKSSAQPPQPADEEHTTADGEPDGNKGGEPDDHFDRQHNLHSESEDLTHG